MDADYTREKSLKFEIVNIQLDLVWFGLGFKKEKKIVYFVN